MAVGDFFIFMAWGISFFIAYGQEDSFILIFCGRGGSFFSLGAPLIESECIGMKIGVGQQRRMLTLFTFEA